MCTKGESIHDNIRGCGSAIYTGMCFCIDLNLLCWLVTTTFQYSQAVPLQNVWISLVNLSLPGYTLLSKEYLMQNGAKMFVFP